jgi:hypothetical protein
MLYALILQNARAQDVSRNDGSSAGIVHFDLPAQPLAQVLQAFGRMTELVLLAPAPLLEGRTSAPVSGDFLPRDALLRVLAGTGLMADFTGPDEALIVAEAEPSAPAPAASVEPPGTLTMDGLAGNSDQRAYAAMVQARLTEALCALPVTRPGTYRLVAQLRIDDRGAVTATALVASSGSAPRDAAIERAIRTLRFDSAPPPGLPEPVTILLRPTGNGVHIDCPPTDERG